MTSTIKVDTIQDAAGTYTLNLGSGNSTLPGGIHLGGTGSANLLDDYEEGTHTTTLTLGSGSATMSKDKLYYTKIGRVVHIIGTIRIDSVSSPSSSLAFSVPFVHMSTTDGEAQAGAAITTNIVATGQNRDFYLEQSEGVSYFYVYDAATASLTNAGDILKANTTLRINYSYHTT